MSLLQLVRLPFSTVPFRLLHVAQSTMFLIQFKIIKLNTLLIFTILLTSNAFAEPLRITTITNSQYVPVGVEIITEAYRRIGLEIKIVAMPASAALEHANRGLSDAELFRIDNINLKYKNLIKIPVVVNSLEGNAVVKDKNIKISQWQDLSNYRFGIRKGVRYMEMATKDMNKEVVQDNKQLLKMLLADRVDIIILSRLNAIIHLREPEYKDFIIIEPSLTTLNLFHYVNKKNKHLVEPLTKALMELEEEGFIKKVRADFIESLQH